MIVRIATEGQYRLPDDQLDRLEERDSLVVAAVESGDDEAFTRRYRDLLDHVRRGEPLDDDDLAASDLILPPADLTIEEAAVDFTGEGLIPDA